MKVLLAAWLLTLSLPTPGAESDLKLYIPPMAPTCLSNDR
jgi:hypothetical protein